MNTKEAVWASVTLIVGSVAVVMAGLCVKACIQAPDVVAPPSRFEECRKNCPHGMKAYDTWNAKCECAD